MSDIEKYIHVEQFTTMANARNTQHVSEIVYGPYVCIHKKGGWVQQRFANEEDIEKLPMVYGFIRPGESVIIIRDVRTPTGLQLRKRKGVVLEVFQEKLIISTARAGIWEVKWCDVQWCKPISKRYVTQKTKVVGKPFGGPDYQSEKR